MENLVIRLSIAALTAFLFSYFFTPLVIKIAHHVNAIDVPKDDRRVHKEPIPLIGGLGIYVAVMLCMMILIL